MIADAKLLAEQLAHATEKVRRASAKTEHEDSELHVALGDLYGCVGRAATALRSTYVPSDELVEEINRLCDHQIPFYAYGDNQAAVEMAGRLKQIAELLPSPSCESSEG